jgi:hypothetical protein
MGREIGPEIIPKPKPRDKKKEAEKAAFWEEYHRRLALKETRELEIRQACGWSNATVGLTTISPLPVPDYSDVGPHPSVVTERPLPNSTRPPESLFQRRRIHKPKRKVTSAYT